LAETNRFSEAEPLYREAIEEILDLDDFDAAARMEGAFGTELLKAGRLDEAESALSEGLWLVRIHRLNASANILSALAQLKSRRGDIRSAAALFNAALDAPPNISPVWLIRSSRGRFRLENDDLRGAMDDFREARGTALEMRADMVPADQDRVALETGLSSVMEGLVDAGNLLSGESGERRILQETFDVAEQDRMWSLRALVPSPNDWRSRLPEHYWELLAQYQSLERTAVPGRSAEATRGIEGLRRELQRIEVDSAGEKQVAAAGGESPLAHAQAVLNKDSVLLSFLITKNSAWVWAVDHEKVAVYPLPPPAKIQADATALTEAIRHGDLRNSAAREVYRDLFGGIPAVWLEHSRWLIEPDGPLHDLPFAALVTNSGDYLVERAAVETIPGALLLERGAIPAGASFLGIGDPIYNSADPRYRGPRYRGRAGKPDLTLARLPNTAGELEKCSRVWGSGAPRLLFGGGATAGAVKAALSGDAGIVHFATHVITAPGEFRSGLIALSLDQSGAIGLLGPKEIVAWPVTASLVVMNGCHSARGETLPSTGLMGLTRAWIGAGAKGVISTGWDVPDSAAESIMADFYGALRSAPERGAAIALRDAQLKAIRRDGGSATEWAAYSLLSRLQ
jgi:CHAT domain-containing protein/tetratricopeptide (TPR) repeat protein